MLPVGHELCDIRLRAVPCQTLCPLTREAPRSPRGPVTPPVDVQTETAYLLTYLLTCLPTNLYTYYFQTDLHAYMFTYLHTYILTCIHTYLHTHTLTYLHKYILTSHAYLLKLLHPCILKYSYILTYMRHIPYHYILAYFYTYIISNLPARTRIFLQQYKLTYSNPYRLTYILTNLHTI